MERAPKGKAQGGAVGMFLASGGRVPAPRCPVASPVVTVPVAGLLTKLDGELGRTVRREKRQPFL